MSDAGAGTGADEVLVEAVRRELHALADPRRAPQMQAYLKSAMPCLGVPVPATRAVVRNAARSRPPGSTDQLRSSVLALWRPARFREERYAATALTAVPAARALRRPELLDLYHELIVDGAWWDHVDEVAHRVGELLADFPDDVRPTLESWQTAGDRWLRRVTIICQLGARDRTDVRLLRGAIEANSADPDFFVRKAIGWALRDYARTAPGWVREFVASCELSPLSRREALKHLATTDARTKTRP